MGEMVWLIALIATWIGWTLMFKDSNTWMVRLLRWLGVERLPNWFGWTGYAVIAVVFVLIHKEYGL